MAGFASGQDEADPEHHSQGGLFIRNDAPAYIPR